MASAIDITKPPQNTGIVSADMRANFTTAASEITDLQNRVAVLEGTLTALVNRIAALEK
jgi:hypothetical protein